MTEPERAQVPSLCEWAGGPPAIRRLIDAF